jgi:hypothetical protein
VVAISARCKPHSTVLWSHVACWPPRFLEATGLTPSPSLSPFWPHMFTHGTQIFTTVREDDIKRAGRLHPSPIFFPFFYISCLTWHKIKQMLPDGIFYSIFRYLFSLNKQNQYSLTCFYLDFIRLLETLFSYEGLQRILWNHRKNGKISSF